MIEQVCITILPEREKDQSFIQNELIKALEKKALGSKALASAIKDALGGKALASLQTKAPGEKAASGLQTGIPGEKAASGLQTNALGEKETFSLQTGTHGEKTTSGLQTNALGEKAASGLQTNAPGEKAASGLQTGTHGEKAASGLQTNALGEKETFSLQTGIPGEKAAFSLQTGIPGEKAASGLQTNAPGEKAASVLQTRAPGEKAASSLQTGIHGEKAASSLQTCAHGEKEASSLQTGTHGEKETFYLQTDTAVAKTAFSLPAGTTAEENISFVFSKKSLDARHGKAKFVMRYDVYIGEKAPSQEDLLPQWKSVKGSKCKSVLVVGSGPAGLFGALKLLEGGIKPIIIERGSDTKTRKVDIAKISTRGLLDSDSNYCFGEGGAGTFSDGKLFTRSNKRGNVGQVLRIFNHFGADASILTDAHPHIGTDKLPYIINAMRAKIIELGGEFHFNTRCTGFITSGKNSVDGIKTVNTKSGEEKDFFADAVLLATGHSAGDIYELLAKTAPQALEAKTFAAGVRIEHPRATIDAIQFHGRKMPNAAEYSLTSQQTGSSKTGNAASYGKEDERGVYTFCMCPGGFVVPSATESGTIVVNGMSAAKRNSNWSNSAVVVETRPEDIPEKFKEMAKKNGCSALAGLYFRSSIEREAFLQANTGSGGYPISGENSTEKENSMEGQKAPAQLLEDFLSHKKSPQEKLPKTSYFPGITSSRLDQWLPAQIARRMEKAFKEFNKKMKGFICGEALLIAPETRTSTPVRILRDRESYECCALKKLYPAGEGSGYSGGIVSSAMDGINACAKIMERL